MNYLNQIGEGIIGNGQAVYASIMLFLPKFLVAVVIALAGYFIAMFLKKMTVRITRKLKVDSLVSRTNLDEQLEDAGIRMKISTFLGLAVKWIILIITLLFITGMFPDLAVVRLFISQILLVIGSIVVALFIFAISVYAARFAGILGAAVANYVDFKNTKLISDIIKFVIYFAAFVQILGVLGLDKVSYLVNQITGSVLTGVAIAIGIAFGFGGQDKARDFVERLKK